MSTPHGKSSYNAIASSEEEERGVDASDEGVLGTGVILGERGGGSVTTEGGVEQRPEMVGSAEHTTVGVGLLTLMGGGGLGGEALTGGSLGARAGGARCIM